MLSFGIKTNPVHVAYGEILRVWREADAIPEIEHAWLWDHFQPLFGPADGPILEGWTLLAALAAQTSRLRLGLMVTNNRARPPAVLAKIAATVDVISGGRLVMGLGVGGTRQPGPNPAVTEYAATGLTLVPAGEGVARLDETARILRLMWSGSRFDFPGPHFPLSGAIGRPVPVQEPGPPLLIGGWGDRTLRVVAEHADLWNVPGPPHQTVAYLAGRARVLDGHCAAIGRDPAAIVRSTQIVVGYDDPAAIRDLVRSLHAIGFEHIVLALRPPYPPGVAAWVAEEIVRPVCASLVR
jgi:alkanesulfonate monooxygenase SsuD/methylene tetrahydromethanopterin reductase-like flavin-dependent oxidoreductase (luciferase family)